MNVKFKTNHINQRKNKKICAAINWKYTPFYIQAISDSKELFDANK